MSNVVDQVLAQQAKRASQSQFESTDLTKYFTIALPQGVSRGEKTFRMLPPKPDQLVFTEIWFHSIKVGNNHRKLYDPGKNEGKPSPLSDVYNLLKASNDPSDKALARNYRPRLFYVIKGIEREKENEGVKFWRFPHDDKGGGIFDLISPIFKKFGDITDPKTGRDLSLTLTKVKNKQNNGEYTAISAILPNDPSPLSTNEQLSQQWIDDTMTWENVYKKYDTEYLFIVAEGNIPAWSEAENKWIAKTEADDTEGSGTQDNIGNAVGATNTPTPPAAQTDHPAVDTDPVAGDDISPDDLPF
jgi:hypothetical protein